MKAAEVLRAYRQGYFPMGDEDGRIRFYCYNPRAILPLDQFHVPSRMARELRKAAFEIRFNSDFEGVIRGCSERSSTWIHKDIIRVYLELYAQGHAHSVEAWRDGKLAGGLYGLGLGGAFCGESMFHRVPSASKAAIVALVGRLQERGYGLLDCQSPTEHTQRFGTVMIPIEQYLQRLQKVTAWPCTFVDKA